MFSHEIRKLIDNRNDDDSDMIDNTSEIIEKWLLSFGFNDEEVKKKLDVNMVSAFRKLRNNQGLEIFDLFTIRLNRYNSYKNIEKFNRILMEKLSCEDAVLDDKDFEYCSCRHIINFIKLKYSKNEQNDYLNKLLFVKAKQRLKNKYDIMDCLNVINESNMMLNKPLFLEGLFKHFKDESILIYNELIEKQVLSFNDKTIDGSNILHYITKPGYCNLSLLEKYINCGLSVYEKNDNALTPIDLMVIQRNESMMEILINNFYSEQLIKDIKFKIDSELISYAYSNGHGVSDIRMQKLNEFIKNFNILKEKSLINRTLLNKNDEITVSSKRRI